MADKNALCYDSMPGLRSGVAIDLAQWQRAAARHYSRVPHIRALDAGVSDSACVPMTTGIPGLNRLRNR